MAGIAKSMTMPSGQVIWVRVDDDEDDTHHEGDNPPIPAQAGSGRFSLRKRRPMVVSADDPTQLQGFTDAVSGIAESVRDGLKHASPDTVEIEFGLDIDVSSGVAISLIADARAKAAVRIKLGWDNSAERALPPYSSTPGV